MTDSWGINASHRLRHFFPYDLLTSTSCLLKKYIPMPLASQSI